jgi:hypothetical protein
MTESLASEATNLGSLRVTDPVRNAVARGDALLRRFATAPSGIYAVIVAVFCGLLLIS